MKHKFLFLLLGFFLLSQLVIAQINQIEVGTYAGNASSAPISTNHNYSYTQQIYAQNLIGVPGMITKLNYVFAAGNSQNSSNWIIYMAHTNKTKFDATFDWIPASQMTQVYSGSVSIPAPPNLMSITLTTPFMYNNSQNLVIAVYETQPGMASSGGSWAAFNKTPDNTLIYYNNSSAPDPNSPPSALASVTYLNYMLFDMLTPINAFPWTETFEASSLTRVGWTQQQEAGNDNWTWDSGSTGVISAAQEGVLNARFVSKPGTGSPRTKLISPLLDLSGGADYKLKLWYAQPDNGGNINETKIFYRTSLSAPWNELAHYTGDVSGWSELADIALPNPSSRYQIAIEGINNGGHANVIDRLSVYPENPVLNLNIASKDFGSLQKGSASPSQQVIIKNVGGGVLPITSVSLQGANPSDFVLTDPQAAMYPWNLNGNESISMNVAFKPKSFGAKTAKLVVTDALSKTVHEISLFGYGTNFIMNQDFESYANFTLNLSPFTQYDGDGQPTYTINGVTFPNQGYTGSYIAFNPTATSPAILAPAHSGIKFAASIAARNTPNNDWLITPGFVAAQSAKVGFWAKSYTHAYGAERFKVLVSTTDANPASFAVISPGPYIEAPLAWTYYEYPLNYPGQTIYVAIQCVSADAFIFMVDDFAVSVDYDIVDLGPDAVVDIPSNTSVSITGGNANLEADLDIGSLPAWNNPGFTLASAFKLELFGFGPWTINIDTDAPWAAFYHDGTWTAVHTIEGGVSITIAPAKGDDEAYFILGDSDPTLPVVLSSFTATLTADMAVTIAWVVQSETNHSGYNVLRAELDEMGSALRINPSLITDGSALGSQISYYYTDHEASMNMVYYYWLESLAMDGVVQYAGPVRVVVGDPSQPPEPPAAELITQLLDAYPNPFNPNTTIRYSLKTAGRVDISIFNLKGQLVQKLSANHNSPGYYQIGWGGKDMQGKPLASGIYLYRMTSGKYSANKKMILAK